jgi:hypothetical protein
LFGKKEEFSTVWLGKREKGKDERKHGPQTFVRPIREENGTN